MRGLSATISSMNGVLVLYVFGLVNAILDCVTAFGVSLTPKEQGTILAATNAALVLIGHASHANAKHTKPVIPAPPLDYSHSTAAQQMPQQEAQ